MQAVPGHFPFLIPQAYLILVPKSIHFAFPPFLLKNIILKQRTAMA